MHNNCHIWEGPVLFSVLRRSESFQLKIKIPANYKLEALSFVNGTVKPKGRMFLQDKPIVNWICSYERTSEGHSSFVLCFLKMKLYWGNSLDFSTLAYIFHLEVWFSTVQPLRTGFSLKNVFLPLLAALLSWIQVGISCSYAGYLRRKMLLLFYVIGGHSAQVELFDKLIW